LNTKFTKLIFVKLIKEAIMAKNIAEVMVEILAAAGVQRVYGLPGDSINGFTDALRVHRQITWAHVRHEETAAFAAGAEAHLTGELAVCAGSCGPGNLHFINGLFDCYRSRVPVLALAAHIPSPEIGSNYFQETHPQNLFKECSHYCEMVGIPEQMPRLMEIAMRTAINLRTVAVLVIPGDIMLRECPERKKLPPVRRAKPLLRPNDEELAQAAELLNSANAVTILGGAGCAGAHDQLIAAADKLKAPIVHALRGKEFIEYDNPFDVGMTGLLGFASGYRAMMRSDTLLMLGTDFPYPQFIPQEVKIIQVDIRGEQIGRRAKVDLGLIGNVRDTLDALSPLLLSKTTSRHLDESVAHYREARRGLDALATGEPGRTPIHPQFVAKTVNALSAQDAIFTCDVGTPTVWAARYLRMNGKRRLIGSFSHGSMACALPQAIGAQMAFPNRQVVSLSGDGGLAMLMGDMLTLKQLKLPVKIVVFHNAALAFVELEMKAAGFIDFGTDLENPSFAKLAEAAGMYGARVEVPEALEGALRQAFEYNGPALVEVMVNRQELSMPPTITLDQAKGFTLYMARAILNGRGDEILDLAKTNLLR
jgi:pyruvate dehydrogenase (quinone)